MELHSPGVGFPSAAAIIAACLYFLPIYVTGIASEWIILLFVAGFILIVLEMFVVPGFGVTGIAGIVLVSLALIFGMIENYSFSLSHASTRSLWMSLVVFFRIAPGCCSGVVAHVVTRTEVGAPSYGPDYRAAQR